MKCLAALLFLFAAETSYADEPAGQVIMYGDVLCETREAGEYLGSSFNSNGDAGFVSASTDEMLAGRCNFISDMDVRYVRPEAELTLYTTVFESLWPQLMLVQFRAVSSEGLPSGHIFYGLVPVQRIMRPGQIYS